MTYSDAEIERLADRLDREAICYLPPYGNFTPEKLHCSRAAAMLRRLLAERRNFSAEMKRRDDNWLEAMKISEAVVKDMTGRQFAFAYPSHLASQQEGPASIARAYGLTPPQDGDA